MKIDFKRLYDKSYRMDNLYRIVDRFGDSIPFRMTDVQRNVFDNLHTRNLILKARQLGMSTFSVLYLLDEALFNRNMSCGIVSYSLQHAQHILKRIIGHALDKLPPGLGDAGIIQRSAHEISFSNGSFLRVDTTLRGGTCQVVLVSEFGKTCARSPQKAEEIVAGTLNTLSQSGIAIIESTGEGTDGYFADMVNSAAQRGNDDLSPLDYKLFFYPWNTEPTYVSDYRQTIDTALTDYFAKIEKETGTALKQTQKNWYVAKSREVGDKMRQEFPSTIAEAFLTSSDAYYYAECIAKAYDDNRMLSTNPYDALLPVYVAMDIGATDLTVIVFFQVVHGEIRIIDYYADNNKGPEFYARFLQQEKNYLYATIYLPHDAEHVNGIVVENTYLRDMSRLFEHTSTRVQVLKRTSINTGITAAKIKFDRTVWYLPKTRELISHLGKYRKKWHEATGKYIDEPLHDINSHYADAYRYMAQAVSSIEAAGNASCDLEKHRQATAARARMI